MLGLYFFGGLVEKYLGSKRYLAFYLACGVFGGSVVRRLKQRSFDAPRAASAALLLVTGLAFTSAGISWF